MNSPEPIIRNDFVEEAETFVHSVLGDVLIQHLVVPGGGDNHGDTGGDSDNGDGGDASNNKMLTRLQQPRREP